MQEPYANGPMEGMALWIGHADLDDREADEGGVVLVYELKNAWV